MPGNEVVDKVHNFFEQESLSERQHQPQAARGNWPFFNTNPWVGNPRPIESHISSNLKNFNILQADSDIGNGRPSPRMQLGPDFTQLTSRPEFTRGQSSNQQLSLNGFMHGQQGFQTRHNPTEFLEEDAVSNTHNIASRGSSFLEIQQANTPELSPALSRTSERSEVADSPVNFNFIGGQQQLMRGQQSGMPQPRPRQQMGLNDMQSLQQQFMFKQLQELQRQQQLQQLDHEARELNPMNQLSTITKQAAGDQLPRQGNGTHIHNTSNFFWPAEHIGGDSRIPSTSQMFMAGNMNWVQHGGPSAAQGYPSGLNSSHDQGQASRPMGLPQQLDQSLYGTPVGSMRGALNQYSHLQGIPQDFSDMLTKASSNQLEKPTMQSSSFSNSFQGDQSVAFQGQIGMQDGTSVSKQSFQGKNLFGQNHFQGINTGVQLGNFQQVNSLPRNASVQEFHEKQQQAGWLHEKTSNQGAPFQSSVRLDPTEEKILFSSDNNGWDAIGGSSILTGGSGNPLENANLLNGFPSVQGGAWTALMQSALEESSSDTVVQDEWSGLSFHKTEMSTGNQAATVSDSPKVQKDWIDKNLPSASSLTSRPFPLFDDANIHPSGHSVSGSQQPRTKFSGEQSERIQPNASQKYIDQSPKESLKWLNHSSEQKPHVQGNHLVQPPMHLENASGGAWPGQFYEQLETSAHSRDMGLNAQNMDGSWVHRQNHSSSKIDSQPCRSNGWNTNELLSSNGNASLKMHANDNTMQNIQTNDLKIGMHMERDCDGGMWKAGHTQVATSFSKLSDGSGTGSHHVSRESSHMSNSTAGLNSNFAKVNQDAHRQVQYSNHLEYGNHVIDSSVKYKGAETMAKYQHQVNKKEISNESYNSNQSHHNATGGIRENSWLNPSESRSFGSGNQKSMGQVGRKASGSRKFQYHPMGDLAVNVEPADTRNHGTHSQSLSRQVVGGSKSLEQRYHGYPKFVGQIPNNSTHVEEGQLPKIPEDVRGSAELPSRGMHHDSTVSSSFDGSTGFYAQNKSHMLELLHKVDQSRENSSVTHFGSSDRIPPSRMPEAEASDASVVHLQRDQSAASQGFGLRLAPPTQRLPVPNHAFSSQKPSQTVNDLNSKHVDPEVGEKSQTWLNPTSPLQPLPPREMLHGEYWDNKSSISGEAANETSQSKKSAALFTGASSYQRDQLQHQQETGANGDSKTDQPLTSDRRSSHFRQMHDAHSGLVADQSAQTSLPGTTSRNPPFNLSHPMDTPQHMSTNSSYPRVSGQHAPVLESLPVSQPSVTSGMSRQGTFSTMSHNVWTSAPAPQHVGSPSQSINLSNRNLERDSLVQKQDGHGIRKLGNVPEFGTCSINSHPSAYGEEQTGKERSLQQVPCEKVHLDPETSGASQGQKFSGSGKHLPGASSIATDPSVDHPHHEVLDRRRYGKDPISVPQTEHVPVRNLSNREFEAFGQSLTQAHASQPNYSLLQQVQDMKIAEADPDTRAGKRFKGSHSGPDTQQIAAKSGQQLFDGNNAIVRNVADNEVNATSLQKSFLSRDGRVVRGSAEVREDHNTYSSQPVPGDLLSKDMSAFGQKDSKDCSSHHNTMSVRSENPQISPLMAPSWFEQYGTFKNGKMLPVHNSSRTTDSTFQRLFSGKSSESLLAHTSIERVNVADAGQVGNVCQKADTTLIASEQISPPPSFPSEVPDQSLSVLRPKKRKNEKLELLPWHKEVMLGSQRLLNISMAEQDWAQAANRLVEKVEDEVEMFEDGEPVFRRRRRLILTTQLMQQLLQPPPPAILSSDATSYYETVTYFIAKLALGDACSLISSRRSDSCLPADNGILTSEKLKTSERVSDQYISKVVEDFIGRARKLESDLLRLDKRSSILEIRLDGQELERFSMINRGAKFHGRGQADGAETSSSSSGAVMATTPHKVSPQRYVVARPMPRNLPQGVQCLSL